MTSINGTTRWLLNRVQNVLKVLFSWREVQSLSFADSCKHALENLVMPNFTCDRIIVKTGNTNNTSEIKTALFLFLEVSLIRNLVWRSWVGGRGASKTLLLNPPCSVTLERTVMNAWRSSTSIPVVWYTSWYSSSDKPPMGPNASRRALQFSWKKRWFMVNYIKCLLHKFLPSKKKAFIKGFKLKAHAVLWPDSKHLFSALKIIYSVYMCRNLLQLRRKCLKMRQWNMYQESAHPPSCLCSYPCIFFTAVVVRYVILHNWNPSPHIVFFPTCCF